MKKIYFLIIFTCLQVSVFAQQLDCSGSRYLDSLFDVTVTSNVLYGQNTNYNGTPRDLMMDVYTPSGDTISARPLIIFAPKGSFISESKTELTMVQLCTHFASLGYVAVAIDYRVGVNYALVMQNAPKEFTLAVLRAAHDYKAAIRYFRKDYATTNTYKIDTNVIIAGGSSAGAITAVHVAYLDKPSEIPSGFDTTGLGGSEGYSGNPGYSTKVHYVVNLCGAIADTSWIEPGNVPVVSMHGNLDSEVPYGTAMITMIVPIMEVDGSASINLRAQHIGVENPFYTFWGRTHIPYDENAGGSFPLYMDTVLNYVTTNLHTWLCNINYLNKNNSDFSDFSISPNPATNLFTLNINGQKEIGQCSLELFDITGKSVFITNFNIQDKSARKSVNISLLKPGIYFVHCTTSSQTVTKKLIIK